MISIIIPLYNAAKTLGKSIDSALDQSFSDFELLCIDDGSQDETLHLLREYEAKDSRIRVFAQENRGVSAARNIGLKEAKGEFITFLDADDWVERDWLKDYIENYRGEDLLFQNAIWERADGTQFLRSIIMDRKNSCGDKILYLYNCYVIYNIWVAIFKRDIIINNNITFNENIAYAEDGEFAIHYCQYIKDINIIPLPVRNYHYVLPIVSRVYNIPSYKRALAILLVAKRGLEMSKIHKIPFFSINNRTTSDLFYTLIMAYRYDLPQEERMRIIEVAQSLPYRPAVNKLKFKVINLLLRLNIRQCDWILNHILRENKDLKKDGE